MKTITLQLALICVLLCACKETSNDLTQKSEKKEALNELKEALNKLTEDKAADQEEITNDSNHDVTIKFADLTISLKDINVFWWEAEGNNTDNVYETEKDTAFFDLNPGDEVFEKSFRIEQTAFDIIELYGQFEIKVALETKRELKVPVCILENWKGYTSKWIKLKIDHKDWKFGTIDEKTDHPVNFRLDEFKGAVEKHCGSEWLNDIKHIDAVDKLPVNLFTTKYSYKIKVRNSKTNEVIEKIIVFYTPTSC